MDPMARAHPTQLPLRLQPIIALVPSYRKGQHHLPKTPVHLEVAEHIRQAAKHMVGIKAYRII